MKIKGQTSQSKHVTRINWGKLINRSVHLICTAAMLLGRNYEIVLLQKEHCSLGKKNLLFLPCNIADVQNLNGVKGRKLYKSVLDTLSKIGNTLTGFQSEG